MLRCRHPHLQLHMYLSMLRCTSSLALSCVCDAALRASSRAVPHVLDATSQLSSSLHKNPCVVLRLARLLHATLKLDRVRWGGVRVAFQRF